MSLLRFFPLLLLLLEACAPADNTQAVLHTGMGEIRVRLFDRTPAHRESFMTLAESVVADQLTFYRVERDGAIEFGFPADSLSHVALLEGEIGAPVCGGALAAVAAEPGRSSTGGVFFLVLDRPQTEATLDAAEQKLKVKFTAQERRAYLKNGGLPELHGQVTVCGEIVSGLEVAQRIAAVPRDKQGRPLSAIPVRIEIAQ